MSATEQTQPGIQDDDFRLGERQRTWETPVLQAPPLAATQRNLAERWDQLTDARRAVCEQIDQRRDEYITLLQSLVRIPSVNPSPEMTKPLATFVADRMRELGMDVRQMETTPNNVSNLGRLAGSGRAGAGDKGGLRSLLYYAHLDTVPAGDERNWRFPPFSATIADGRIWGRGAKDCKLGMASALAATSAVRAAGIPLAGDLLIVTPCDEETGGHLGIASMIDAGWLEGIDACIYGEGMPEQLTIGAKGGVDFRVTVRGRSAHTSRKQMGINAILHAAAVAQAIDALAFDDYTEHPVVPGGPIASVNLINGGFKLNVVPDSCTLDVDLRFPPGYTAEQALTHVRRAIDELRADPRYHDLDAEISLLGVMRPYAMDPTQPVVQALGMAVEDVTGKAPVARGMVASSDARWIYLDARIPTVNFSFGNESAHVPNEYVDVEGYIANIKAYALANLLLLT